MDISALSTKLGEFLTPYMDLGALFMIFLVFTLIGLVIGQITVGYAYIFAQIVYLICNTASVIRDIKLQLPPSNIVRDACFTAITISLIIIRAFFG